MSNSELLNSALLAAVVSGVISYLVSVRSVEYTEQVREERLETQTLNFLADKVPFLCSKAKNFDESYTGNSINQKKLALEQAGNELRVVTREISYIRDFGLRLKLLYFNDKLTEFQMLPNLDLSQEGDFRTEPDIMFVWARQNIVLNANHISDRCADLEGMLENYRYVR